MSQTQDSHAPNRQAPGCHNSDTVTSDRYVQNEYKSLGQNPVSPVQENHAAGEIAAQGVWAGFTGLRYLATIILGFIVFNILWHAAAVIVTIDALPRPLAVYADWSKALHNNLHIHSFSSILRVFLSLAAAIVIALALAIPMGTNRRVNNILAPLLYFSYPIPKLALLPIVMILLGVGDGAKITIIVLIIVFQLVIAIRDAISNIPPENYALLTALGATPCEKLRHITLPAALPTILSSLRVSIGIALSALFFTETFGTVHGLGFYITDCWMRRDYLQMYFGIIVLSMIGVILFIALDILEKTVCAWKASQTA